MTIQPCGHDARYIVQADEGTAFCAMCELIAQARKLDELIDRISDVPVHEFRMTEDAVFHLRNLVKKLWSDGEITKLPEAA